MTDFNFMPDATPSASPPDTPLLVEPYRRFSNLNSGRRPARFTPAARLVVTEALRTSGLLAALSDRDARTLLAVLTFLSPNGVFQATAPGVAEALGVAEKAARERLTALAKCVWHGGPLVNVLAREQASDRYVPGRQVVAWVQEADTADPHEAASLPPSSERPYVPAGREAVMGHSRAAYARPRAEVERDVLAFLGHDARTFEDTPEGAARRRLLGLGVPNDVVEALVREHPLQAVTDQLDWLPQREARNPARFVVRAIQDGYDPPAGVRLERAMDELEGKQKPHIPDNASASFPEQPSSKSKGPIGKAE